MSTYLVQLYSGNFLNATNPSLRVQREKLGWQPRNCNQSPRRARLRCRTTYEIEIWDFRDENLILLEKYCGVFREKELVHC